VDLSGKFVRLLPQQLAVGNPLKGLAFDPVAHQLGHVVDEFQVAALGVGGSVWPLKNFNKTNDLFPRSKRADDEKMSSRICFRLLLAKDRHRRDQLSFSFLSDPPKESQVLSCAVAVDLQQLGLHGNMVSQLQRSIVFQEPDSASVGDQRLDDALEYGRIEFRRCRISFGHIGDFLHQRPDLTLCLFDRFLRRNTRHDRSHSVRALSALNRRATVLGNRCTAPHLMRRRLPMVP